MVVANLAESSFAQGEDYVAKPVLIEKGTAFPRRKREMGAAVLLGDIFSEALSESAGNAFIVFKAFAVNINFPAGAAAVPAVAGDTAETFVLVRR